MPKNLLMRHEVRLYLQTLNTPELLRIFDRCESLTNEITDTLNDDFQIASALTDVFWKFANRRQALMSEHRTLEEADKYITEPLTN